MTDENDFLPRYVVKTIKIFIAFSFRNGYSLFIESKNVVFDVEKINK